MVDAMKRTNASLSESVDKHSAPAELMLGPAQNHHKPPQAWVLLAGSRARRVGDPASCSGWQPEQLWLSLWMKQRRFCGTWDKETGVMSNH